MIKKGKSESANNLPEKLIKIDVRTGKKRGGSTTTKIT